MAFLYEVTFPVLTENSIVITINIFIEMFFKTIFIKNTDLTFTGQGLYERIIDFYMHFWNLLLHSN